MIGSAWCARDRLFRAGALVALATAMTLSVQHKALALDDRYPGLFQLLSPSTPPPNPSEPAGRHKKPAARTTRPTPPVNSAATTPGTPPNVPATPPSPASAAMPPVPHNASLDGIALDPKWPKQLFVISDSVMLGAKPQLIKALPDWQVNFQGRPALMIPKAMEELPGSVGSVAVVALGYNSLWQKDRLNFQRWADAFDKSAEAMVTTLKQRGARKIIWTLLRELNTENVPGNGTASMQSSKYGWYFPYVNERLRALKERHPEIALADWVTVARQSGITYDAIHLNPRGAELMVDVVRTAIGLGPRPPKQVAEAKPPEAGAPPKETQPQTPAQTQAPVQAQTPAQPQAPAQTPGHEEHKAPEPALGLRTSDTETFTATIGPMLKPSYALRDCAKCPEMVVIPAGSFTMGAPEDEPDRNANEGPTRVVTIARPLAVGKFEVTFAEWEACVAGGGCKGNPTPGDEGWGKERQPVINVSWDDAQEYVAWLSRATGKTYRLLTEAEWEYAARAGTSSPFATGKTITPDQANFQTSFKDDGSSREGEYREQTIRVGSFPGNAFDLHDMHGNAWEWVQDNWHDDYAGAPTDGSVVPGGDTTMRVQRGGGWYSLIAEIRSASRHADQPDHRGADIGFRVARGL